MNPITKEKLRARIEEMAYSGKYIGHDGFPNSGILKISTKMADALVLLAEALEEYSSMTSYSHCGSERCEDNGALALKALADAARLLGLESGE